MYGGGGASVGEQHITDRPNSNVMFDKNSDDFNCHALNSESFVDRKSQSGATVTKQDYKSFSLQYLQPLQTPRWGTFEFEFLTSFYDLYFRIENVFY